jgi:threonine/homoserine/homoserine lactone efflux protein
MISALSAGVVLGLSAGLAPGPLLALVISQTIAHGICEGTKVSLAPLITDLPIVVVSLLVLNQLTEFKPVLGSISLAGGFYILYLSYETFQSRPVNQNGPKYHAHSLRKGALINALNPHPYLFWITVGAPFTMSVRDENLLAPVVFVMCFYVLLVGSKVFVALIIGRSRSFFSGRGYAYTMRLLAGFIALFAFFLLRDGLVLLGILGD